MTNGFKPPFWALADRLSPYFLPVDQPENNSKNFACIMVRPVIDDQWPFTTVSTMLQGTATAGSTCTIPSSSYSHSSFSLPKLYRENTLEAFVCFIVQPVTDKKSTIVHRDYIPLMSFPFIHQKCCCFILESSFPFLLERVDFTFIYLKEEIYVFIIKL
jgi:hypothetical protein